uniref:Tegument protein UL23 n=1 Tax=Cardioderma bat herpesvirus TaxID=3141914 RepID=A0AAU7E246_9VIRU
MIKRPSARSRVTDGSRDRLLDDGDSARSPFDADVTVKGRSLSSCRVDKPRVRRRTADEKRAGVCRKAPAFLSTQYVRSELTKLLGVMAPPEFLCHILGCFETVDHHVINETGRRVKVRWPKDRVVVVGKRHRPDAARHGSEEDRLSSLLCCPEPLKFVGSVCPSETLDDVFNGSAPQYFPEIYVGSSERLFVYITRPRAQSLSVLAKNAAKFAKNGMRGCDIISLGAVSVPNDLKTVRLSACGSLRDALAWRADCFGSAVTVGDGTTFRVCDMFGTRHTPEDLERWMEQTGAQLLEIFGLVSFPPRDLPLARNVRVSLLVDENARIYATVNYQHLLLLADSCFEFACRGLTRFKKNVVFHTDLTARAMSRVPECPNGRTHDDVVGLPAHLGLETRALQRKTSFYARFARTCTFGARSRRNKATPTRCQSR